MGDFNLPNVGRPGGLFLSWFMLCEQRRVVSLLNLSNTFYMEQGSTLINQRKRNFCFTKITNFIHNVKMTSTFVSDQNTIELTMKRSKESGNMMPMRKSQILLNRNFHKTDWKSIEKRSLNKIGFFTPNIDMNSNNSGLYSKLYTSLSQRERLLYIKIKFPKRGNFLWDGVQTANRLNRKLKGDEQSCLKTLLKIAKNLKHSHEKKGADRGLKKYKVKTLKPSLALSKKLLQCVAG